MSQNLDLVRSIYMRWGHGDFGSAAWADPEIEFGFADGPEPGLWNGLEAMSRQYGDWLRGFEGFRAEPEEYIEVDDDRVLVFVRNTGRGKASGAEFEQRTVANFFEIHDGLVTRLILYWDRDRALADAGVGEG